jgi:hypothetical protein
MGDPIFVWFFPDNNLLISETRKKNCFFYSTKKWDNRIDRHHIDKSLVEIVTETTTRWTHVVRTANADASSKVS